MPLLIETDFISAFLRGLHIQHIPLRIVIAASRAVFRIIILAILSLLLIQPEIFHAEALHF